ncbi:MAG TPA: hypothetical protein VHY09_05315 [Candidatus Methylacidiphilales bacterium]|jgi:hypothetical protein|nr:hypothetical protein [Candidatus Methylacidiphilales bacterium]
MQIIVHRNGVLYGPYTLEQVEKGMASGFLSKGDWVFPLNETEWIRLDEVFNPPPPPSPLAPVVAKVTLFVPLATLLAAIMVVILYRPVAELPARATASFVASNTPRPVARSSASPTQDARQGLASPTTPGSSPTADATMAAASPASDAADAPEQESAPTSRLDFASLVGNYSGTISERYILSLSVITKSFGDRTVHLTVTKDNRFVMRIVPDGYFFMGTANYYPDKNLLALQATSANQSDNWFLMAVTDDPIPSLRWQNGQGQAIATLKRLAPSGMAGDATAGH